MSSKTVAMQILEDHNIAYDKLEYEAEVFKSGHDVCAKLGVPEAEMFKTLVVKGYSGQFYVFVLSISKDLDFKKAAKVVGEKSLSFVPIKNIEEVTGYVRGGVTLVGIKKNYRTIINNEMKAIDEVNISAGKLGMCLKLKREDLLNVVNAEFADIEK